MKDTEKKQKELDAILEKKASEKKASISIENTKADTQEDNK